MIARGPEAAVMAERMQQAREDLAGVLFNPVVVLEQIDQAAGAGQSQIRIGNDARVDLTDTKGFRHLCRRLHELGYGARLAVVANQPGEELSERYSELIIGWGVNCRVSVGAPLGLIRGEG